MANEIQPFEARIEDPTASLAEAVVPGGRALLIAFGGIIGKLGIPPFEFFNLTRQLDVSRAYVRDLNQSWYHAGLLGLSSNVRDTASVLADVVSRSGAERVILVGNSMGGYAALLFGALLRADVVLAFSPQTFIDAANRGKHGDARWSTQMERVHRTGDSRHFDLMPLLRDHADAISIDVHYSPSDRLDEIHAERLAGIRGVRLRRYPEGGHNVIRYLKSSGALESIVRDAIAPENPSMHR